MSWLIIEQPNVRIFFYTKLEMQKSFYLQDDKWMQWNDAMSQMYLGLLTTTNIV